MSHSSRSHSTRGEESTRSPLSTRVSEVVGSMRDASAINHVTAATSHPLASIQARHRASILEAAVTTHASTDNIQSHARETRRNGSALLTGGPSSKLHHHINLEKWQMAQLASREAWRTALHKESAQRTAEDVAKIWEWIKSNLARPTPTIATPSVNATATPIAHSHASHSTAAPISPFLQQLPPLVLRGI